MGLPLQAVGQQSDLMGDILPADHVQHLPDVQPHSGGAISGWTSEDLPLAEEQIAARPYEELIRSAGGARPISCNRYFLTDTDTDIGYIGYI